MELDSDEPKSSQSSTSTPTEPIPDVNKQFALQLREQQRAKPTDTVRFALGEIQEEFEDLDKITEQDLRGLVARIIRRKHASAKELRKLSEAFLQSMDNIELFFQVPAALKIIVKDITAIDLRRQVSALECLCNLSLGEAPVCEKIVDEAGRNLVQFLNSTEERLKRTSLWIIANTIYTSPKAAQTIVQMELVPKLFYIYIDNSDEKNIANDFRVDAAVCLQNLFMGKNARKEDILFIKDNMIKKSRNSVAAEYHLKIIFHAEIVNPESVFNIEQTQHLMDFILGNLYTTREFSSVTNRMKIIYALRVLSNMVQCVPTALSTMQQQLHDVWDIRSEQLLNRVFNFRQNLLSLEVVFVIRNLIHDNSPQPLPCRLDKLEVPRLNYKKLLQKK